MNEVAVRELGPSDAHSFAFRSKLPWPLWALYRALRVPAVASAFAGFWLGAVLLAWLVLPVAAFGGRDRFSRVRRCQRIVAWTFRRFHGYMETLRLVEAHVAPLEPPVELVANEAAGRERPRGRVLIANHTTLVDMTAIFGAYPNICCIAKPSMSHSPFIGRLLRLCGFIPAGRDMLERATSIDEACKWIDAGFDILVFPEGTRSPPGSIHRFHRGAFEIAKRAQVPLIPLLLTCRPSALTKGRPFWLHPDECAILTVEPKPSIVPESQTNSRNLRAEVENMYREWMGLSPTS